MSKLVLVIGSKRYSSWSLRPWLAMRQAGLPFDEVLIPFRRSDSKAALEAHSPTAKVPVLRHDGRLVWESLAIMETLSEAFPGAGLWPADAAARAEARAVSAEMHAGFVALREHMPMDFCALYPGRGRGAGVADDIRRIVAIWDSCRERFSSDGPFLFGPFTAADAMFAPVVSRFHTYAVELSGPSQAYADTVRSLPAMAEWGAAAEAEGFE